jgi:hypothetical protein
MYSDYPLGIFKLFMLTRMEILSYLSVIKMLYIDHNYLLHDELILHFNFNPYPFICLHVNSPEFL